MAETIANLDFSDKFGRSLDDKKRVGIPPLWRDPEMTEFYISLRTEEGQSFLQAMPASTRLEKIAEVEASDHREQAKRSWLRKFNMRNTCVAVDKQNRIALPEELCEQAGLSKEVTLVGVGKMFEIWEPAALTTRLETEDEESKAIDDDFAV
jgi:MraZ protein